jgi:hypothetical protein
MPWPTVFIAFDDTDNGSKVGLFAARVGSGLRTTGVPSSAHQFTATGVGQFDWL